MARLLKPLLVCSIAGFIIAAGYISYVTYQRQLALARVSHYNVAWSASQAVIELTRLQQAVTASLVDPATDDVQLRYNIFLNRLSLLDGGEFHEFARLSDSALPVLSELDAVLARIEPLIGNLGTSAAADRAALMQVKASIAPLTPALLALAAAANRYGADLVTADQHTLLRLHLAFSALVGGLIVAGIVLIVLLLWHNGMLERAHATMQRMTGELRGSRSLLNAALNNMSQGLCMVDADQRLIVSNRNFWSLLMVPPELLADGRRFAELLDPVATAAADVASVRDLLAAQLELAAGNVSATGQEELPDGRIVAITHEPMAAGGWVATFEDVTERRRAQDRIAHIAHHDVLTGLPNRLMFHEEIDKAMARVRRHGDALAVLCLDLDDFKPVNDTLGHQVGDALLQVVATRLRACVGELDLVARVGGDEFAIIQHGGERDAGDLAERVVAAISAPYDVQGHLVVIGISVGIARAPQDGTEPAALMKGADLALYEAKKSGDRGSHRFFKPEMAARLHERRTLEQELRRALAESEFVVFYQPLVNLARQEICGFEALVRWNHPQKGRVPPDVFIPLAEEIGLIAPLGEWVLKQACAEAACWPDLLKVAVNLSAVQFCLPRRLIASVQEALAASGLSPQRLELEITETVVLRESDANTEVLGELHDMGVRISMDDFGTGYSSLSYLRSYPFDKIKIDKSFVSDMDNSADSKAIVCAVAGLASTLGMTTTAEGVETQSQFDQLRQQGCTEVQGYLISPAIPAAEIAPFLLQWKTRHGLPADASTQALTPAMGD